MTKITVDEYQQQNNKLKIKMTYCLFVMNKNLIVNREDRLKDINNITHYDRLTVYCVIKVTVERTIN